MAKLGEQQAAGKPQTQTHEAQQAQATTPQHR
jgi:hypothetical protein